MPREGLRREAKDNLDNTLTLFADDDLWIKVYKSLEILIRLTKCIALAERADGTMGDTFASILRLYEDLHSNDWSDPFKAHALSCILHYVNPMDLEEFDLMLAPYVLDKRFGMRYLTICWHLARFQKNGPHILNVWLPQRITQSLSKKV